MSKPTFDRFVVGARHQGRIVLRELQGTNGPAVTRERVVALGLLDVPHLDAVVVRSTHL